MRREQENPLSTLRAIQIGRPQSKGGEEAGGGCNYQRNLGKESEGYQNQ